MHDATAPGTIVLLSDLQGDELLPAIVRRESDDALTVVPVSANVAAATEWDLVLGTTALGYPAVAQVWNFGSALPEQVVDVVAALPDTDLEALDALAHAARAGGPPPEGLPVGPPVLGDADPRMLDQEAAAEEARRFWAPALALAGVETLGQLVAHRREELHIDAADLRPLSPVDGWLEALESDKLDILGSLPSAAMATLLRRLRIGASRRLRRVAHWTIEGQAPALARKGTTIPGPNADDYVEALMHDLEEPRA